MKFLKKLVVWLGVSYKHKNSVLAFAKNRSISNETYVSGVVRPHIVGLCKKHSLTFRRDSAPSHTAKRTQKFLRGENVNFISPDEWSPDFTKFYPFDYCVWGVLKQIVYGTSVQSLDELRRRIVLEWKNLSMDKIKK
jgi:hypothetical protein